MIITASQLHKKISKYDNSVSYKTINRAYNLSKKAHTNQYRNTGEAYFTHPLAVADFLINMRLKMHIQINAERLREMEEIFDWIQQNMPEDDATVIKRLLGNVERIIDKYGLQLMFFAE